jgi:hypothetical protein
VSTGRRWPPLQDSGSTWACLTLPIAFVLWTLTVMPESLRDGPASAPLYALMLVPAAVAAAVIAGLLAIVRRGEWSGRVCYAAALAYLAAFRAAGLTWAPAGALLLVATAALAGRPRRHVPALLLVHVMGTCGGLYLAFSIERYARGWQPLLGLLRALRAW